MSRQMDLIVHDAREGTEGCPTDPDVAGIGVSLRRSCHQGELTIMGYCILCIDRSPDYSGVHRGSNSRRDLDSRHNIPAEEAGPPFQQNLESWEDMEMEALTQFSGHTDSLFCGPAARHMILSHAYRPNCLPRCMGSRAKLIPFVLHHARTQSSASAIKTA